jgi:hypothetical protein
MPRRGRCDCREPLYCCTLSGGFQPQPASTGLSRWLSTFLANLTPFAPGCAIAESSGCAFTPDRSIGCGYLWVESHGWQVDVDACNYGRT